jgi:hypothetical protein
MRVKGSICMVFALAMASTAAAQGIARWGSTLGLQPGSSGFQVTCGTVAFPCDQRSAVPLYSGDWRERPVRVALTPTGESGWQGQRLSLQGKLGKDSAFGFYGRLGASQKPATALMGAAGESVVGSSYGLGVTWDISRSTSAVLGWDTYDLRQGGAERELRATSLGLQWRY